MYVRMCYTNNYVYLTVFLGCLGDMEYHHCGTQMTCNTFSNTDNYNNSNCTSGLMGCFCTSNYYVLEDGMCIHPDTCPSKFYYKQLPNVKHRLDSWTGLAIF